MQELRTIFYLDQSRSKAEQSIHLVREMDCWKKNIGTTESRERLLSTNTEAIFSSVPEQAAKVKGVSIAAYEPAH
jgi:hypothetical protein